jgi:hypothetical protein
MQPTPTLRVDEMGDWQCNTVRRLYGPVSHTSIVEHIIVWQRIAKAAESFWRFVTPPNAVAVNADFRHVT